MCLLFLVISSIVLLGVSHHQYVGENAPLCLLGELEEYRELHAVYPLPANQSASTSFLEKNTILQLRITDTSIDVDVELPKNETYRSEYRFTDNPPLLYLSNDFYATHDVKVRFNCV